MPLLIDAALDAALSYVPDNATTLYACSADPATFAEASATFALGSMPVVAGDFTVGDDDTPGRRLSFNGKTQAGGVTTTGTATHLAFCSADTLLMAQSLGASQVLTSGNPLELPAGELFSIPDPTQQ